MEESDPSTPTMILGCRLGAFMPGSNLCIVAAFPHAAVGPTLDQNLFPRIGPKVIPDQGNCEADNQRASPSARRHADFGPFPRTPPRGTMGAGPPGLAPHHAGSF